MKKRAGDVAFHLRETQGRPEISGYPAYCALRASIRRSFRAMEDRSKAKSKHETQGAATSVEKVPGLCVMARTGSIAEVHWVTTVKQVPTLKPGNYGPESAKAFEKAC